MGIKATFVCDGCDAVMGARDIDQAGTAVFIDEDWLRIPSGWRPAYMPRNERLNLEDFAVLCAECYENGEEYVSNLMGPQLPDMSGHEYGKPYKYGYATCYRCGCRENTEESVNHCLAKSDESVHEATDKTGSESTGDELKDYRHACTEAREALAAIQRILGHGQDRCESDWPWIARRRAEMSLDRINSVTEKYQ